jgi:threonine aldolase
MSGLSYRLAPPCATSNADEQPPRRAPFFAFPERAGETGRGDKYVSDIDLNAFAHFNAPFKHGIAMRACGRRNIVARVPDGMLSLAQRPSSRHHTRRRAGHMFFASDNWAGVHPAVAENLTRHSGGFAAAYGTSDVDRAVERRFNEIFEREVAVFFVGTGTAANALALAAINRPGGVTLCQREAHMIEDECGAPEYFTGGARLHPVEGLSGRHAGKMDPQCLVRELKRFPPGFVHAGQPMAVSLTQATEAGTVHSLDEIAAIASIAREHGLPLHMDGARFANALVSLGCTPAEMTWKAGVDIVSFGGTKNGCWMAEALVFLDPAQAVQLPFIRKRAAQLFSKTRFIAAQFEAYLADDLWLQSARHANAQAMRLAGLFRQAEGIRLGWEPQANEVFPIMHATRAAALEAAGVKFYDWNPPHGMEDLIAPGERLCRFVTSFATSDDHVNALARLI